MPIELKQFNNALVTPKDDAQIYDFVVGQQSGIVDGCEVTHLGGNLLQVSAGWGLICGRKFNVTTETVTAETSGGSAGRILIAVNLSNTNPISFETQSAATLPTLTQEDLNDGGDEYELPLYTYTITDNVISDLVDVRRMISMDRPSILEYQSTWNASTNSPSLLQTDLSKKGFVYSVTTAGAQFGYTFAVGDWLVYNVAGVAEKHENLDEVTSVNGQKGAVVVQPPTNEISDEAAIDDTDTFPYWDESVSSHRKTLWSNIKAKLKAYFDPLYTEIVWLESTANLTAPGDSTKFYVTGNDNNIWHWNGSNFIIISPTLMLGEIDTRAYRGDRGKIAYDHSQLTSGNPHGTTKTDIGLGLCDNTPDANKIVSTPQQEALDLKADIDKMFYPDNQYGGIISSNLDTIAVTGSYTCYNTATGAPFADSSAFVFHQNSNAGTVSAWQLGLAYTDGRILFRFKRSSAWTAWEKLTADQIGLIDSGGNFDATTAEDALAELATEKANKVQEDYIVPTLLNGYEAYSATTTPKYYKDEFGIVRMKGWLKTGVAGNAAFILQSGYRPSGYPFFPAAQGGSVNPTRIRISDTGEATPSAYSSYICLDGISFRAEN